MGIPSDSQYAYAVDDLYDYTEYDWSASTILVSRTVRDLFAAGSTAADRVRSVVDDAYLATLAAAVTGGLGGKVGVAPRLFLCKLVAEVLDRVEQFGDFDPRQHYALTISDTELTEAERQAARTPDDVDLDV